jgi:hypothetical protein
LLQTILGAVLVVIGAVLTALLLLLLRHFSTKWWWNDYWWCYSDAFTTAAGLASKQDADNKPSYAFGSVTNTAAQGYPVPLGMESAVSAVQLFLPGFTLKTSNKNTSI